MESDKLFYFLFQSAPDLILRWLQDLPADAGGYSFSAPVLKEREWQVLEFIEHRVTWIELQPRDGDPPPAAASPTPCASQPSPTPVLLRCSR